MGEEGVPLLKEEELELVSASPQMTTSDKSSLDCKNESSPEYGGRTGRSSSFFRVTVKSGRVLFAALPQVLPRWMQRGELNNDKLHATSYLDALRGYAAWFVVNAHQFDFRNAWLFQQPVINVFWNGLAMVDVFFVISGFVLSLSMLQKIHQQQKGQLLDSLTSAIFRRYLRLYISCGVATFITMVCVWTKLTDQPGVVRLDSFAAQFWHWCKDFAQFCNPFTKINPAWHSENTRSMYVEQTWTIPVEFRGSLLVFLYCAGTAKLCSKHRMMLCFIMSLACMGWQCTHMALFLWGALLAEISLIRHPQRYKPAEILPSAQTINTMSQRPRRRFDSLRRNLKWRQLGCVFGFFVSLFLLSIHPENGGPWPWPQLLSLVPSYWDRGPTSHFWPSMASPLLIWVLDSSPMLQTPFRWRFSQYLGKLSFGLYVMHFLMIKGLHKKVLAPMAETWFHNSTLAWVVVVFVNWFAIVWVADYFERIDSKVVRFGKWLQKRYFETW